MSDAPAGRFRVGPGTLRPGRIEIDSRQAHHMRVRRVRVGDAVVLFDGAGSEAGARVESIEESGATVTVGRVRRSAAESPLRVVLVQALPVKLPRMDDVVRQATELGVAHIAPVSAERSRTPGGGAATVGRRAERWRRIAEAAAKQCGRAEVPEIAEPRPLADLAVDDLPAPRLLLAPGADVPLTAGLVSGGAATVLIGPEGGWSPREEARLVGLGALPVRFGPRVLRADTAGPAVLAVLQFLAGDLGDPVSR